MSSPDPELDAVVRVVKRARRIPPGSTCAVCGTDDHLSAGPDGEILCYGCRSSRAGRRPFEEDHLAGRANLAGLVVRLRPNSHRTVTELRLSLGLADWSTADGDPLIALAHFLGGLATLLILLAEWLLEYAGELRSELGSRSLPAAARFPIVP